MELIFETFKDPMILSKIKTPKYTRRFIHWNRLEGCGILKGQFAGIVYVEAV